MNPQTSQETSLSRQTPLQASSSRSPGQISQAQSSKNTPNNSETFKKVGKWTPEEDELLKEYVSLYSEKQWKKVSEHIPGRAPIQCLHRWTKILKPGLVKGPWTQEEDQKLIAWVKKQGPGKWAQAANMIPGRSGKQCRERWFNNLNPDVRKGNWTTAEDELIFQLYQKYGSSWSKIAKYVPGRTENSIKNRFYSTLRKFAASKHRANTRPLDSEFPALEAALHNMKTDSGEVCKKQEISAAASSTDGDKNMLYKLLQEVGTKPGQKEENQENTDTLNVKEEEMETVEDVMKKSKVIKKSENEEKNYRSKALAESNKMSQEPSKVLSQNFGKLPNIQIPEHRIRDITNNMNQGKIEEEDPNFERYLLSINHNVQDDLIIRDVDHITETRGGFDELDNLQQKIFDFCSLNIQNLMSAFKTVESSDMGMRKSPSYNQTPTGHSSPGRGTPTSIDNPIGFQKPSIGTTRPFRPVAIKIPPLEIKETGETSIPKILSMTDKSNVLSNIPPFPSKGQEAELLSRVLSERRDVNNKKKDDDEEKVVNQNLNSLIESMNQTIGAASLVYSHYLSNINETVKKMDETNGEESREKVATMFQQLSSIENWLKNAKAELSRLESIVDNDDKITNENDFRNQQPENGGQNVNNKRRLNEENLKKMPGEQPMKKKKIN